MIQSVNNCFHAFLSEKDFIRLSSFIEQKVGIRMPASKRIMLQSRLHKRLAALNMTSFEEYVQYVFSESGKEELVCMIDFVTTNKTEFFREAEHFLILTEKIIPEITKGRNNPYFLKCWSAGCSSGEEVYSLAIVLSEYSLNNPFLDFYILGTDVSTRMLKKAKDAIYRAESVHMIPIELKKKYLLKGKNENSRFVKIIPELVSKAEFRHLNLMDNFLAVPETFDIIFCRNVLIYFERPTQEMIINKLCTKLKKNGFLFLGHSESMIGMNAPVKQILPTIYQKI